MGLSLHDLNSVEFVKSDVNIAEDLPKEKRPDMPLIQSQWDRAFGSREEIQIQWREDIKTDCMLSLVCVVPFVACCCSLVFC